MWRTLTPRCTAMPSMSSSVGSSLRFVAFMPVVGSTLARNIPRHCPRARQRRDTLRPLSRAEHRAAWDDKSREGRPTASDCVPTWPSTRANVPRSSRAVRECPAKYGPEDGPEDAQSERRSNSRGSIRSALHEFRRRRPTLQTTVNAARSIDRRHQPQTLVPPSSPERPGLPLLSPASSMGPPVRQCDGTGSAVSVSAWG